jgi:hypothetical protein
VPVPFEPSFTVERRCDPSPWTLLWRVLLQAWLVICYNELTALIPGGALHVMLFLVWLI